MFFYSRKLIFSGFMTLFFLSFSAQSPVIEVYGAIGDDNTDLVGALVQVSQGGKVIYSTKTDPNGEYSFTLPIGGEYTAEVSREGYVTKKFSVSTVGIPAEKVDAKFQPLGASVNLFRKVEGVDYSLLKQPMMMFRYNTSEETMEYDKNHQAMMAAGIEKIQEAEKEIRRAEKEKESKYATFLKEGDKAFNRKDYTASISNYEQAIAMKPAEAYPKAQVEHIKKLQTDAAAQAKIDEEAKQRLAADAAAKKLADEKAAKEKAETERLAREKADKERADKLAKEKADADAKTKAAADEAEKIAAKKKADELAAAALLKEKQDKEAKEKADKVLADKLAKEKADADAKTKRDAEEAEKLAAKKKADDEAAAKLAKEKSDREAKEKADKDVADKLAKEKADADAKIKADAAEKQKLADAAKQQEAEKLAKQKAEQDRIAAETKAKEKEQADKLAAEKKQKEEKEAAEKKKADDALVAKLAAEKELADKKAAQKAEADAKALADAKKKSDQEELAKKQAADAERAKNEKLLADAAAKEKADAAAKAEADAKNAQNNKISANASKGNILPTLGGGAAVKDDSKYKEAIRKADNFFALKRYQDAKKAYEEALMEKGGDAYAKEKLMECERLLNSDANQVTDERQKQLLAKYPPGVTEETISVEGLVIIKRVLVKDRVAYVYEKKIFNWGGIAYFRDGTPITEPVFEQETKK